MNIPVSLSLAVYGLTFESKSDEKWAHRLIRENTDNATNAMISWLIALVTREGVKFDPLNKDHLFDVKNPRVWEE